MTVLVQFATTLATSPLTLVSSSSARLTFSLVSSVP